MSQDLSKLQRRRVNPFKGLVIDVPIWVDAHNYHRDQQRLHAMSLHQHGIVTGLEAVAWNPPDNSVVIYPGIAIDQQGNSIVVPQPQRFYVKVTEKGIARIVLEYAEIPENTTKSSLQSQGHPMYILEAFRIEEQRQRPEESGLELARIVLDGKSAAIRDASNPLNPAPNEIDTRYRQMAGAISRGHIRLAILDNPSSTRHVNGILNLSRAINQSSDYSSSFVGTISLNDEVRDCDLVFMCGNEEFRFSENEERLLSNFLSRGGVLLGETCHEGTTRSKEQGQTFSTCFAALAQKLGRVLRSVDRGHRLLTVHNLFTAVPPGLNGPASLVEDQGMLYSDGDFGCMWAGGKHDKALPRDTIRTAHELGTNIAIYAYQRTYNQALRISYK
jgi:hypothetical protein